jgi:SHS2 domain-containing protein
MDKGYKILDHPADIKVQAFSKTKEELFLNALKGMAEILKPVPDSESVRRDIKVESIDLDNLLVDFLSEVLYLSQVNKEVYKNIKFISFNDKKLEGELIGDKIRSLGEEIKAVTYHGLEISQKNGLYQATVLFDI